MCAYHKALDESLKKRWVVETYFFDGRYTLRRIHFCSLWQLHTAERGREWLREAEEILKVCQRGTKRHLRKLARM